MDVYRTDFSVDRKADNSPVSEADRRAEEVILARLSAAMPDVPVVAEEAVSAGSVPAIGRNFFLVDPLDGTKEFISRNGEFTVNIGLIEDGVPVTGVVLAPGARACLCRQPAGAWQGRAQRRPERGRRTGRRCARGPPGRVPVAVASRSHSNDADASWR